MYLSVVINYNDVNTALHLYIKCAKTVIYLNWIIDGINKQQGQTHLS